MIRNSGGSEDSLRTEIFEALIESDGPVTLDHLMKNTSAEGREDVKDILQELIDEGQIGTSPGFEYKLASHASVSA
ncbi:MAG: hypothetical protein U5K70_03410 [Halodesulfurarchaeum sp.]|nr:hypothetical protein [Halodesulfurarchaeum sp.]